jgi:UDP-3-O-[3-hydroxymyristoyl] glucosamine N-acyltransferase
MIIKNEKKLAIIGFEDSISLQEVAYGISKVAEEPCIIINPYEFMENPSREFQYLNGAIKNDFVLRKQVTAFLDEHNFDRFTFVHPQVNIYPEMVKMELGVCVGPGAGINMNVKIARDVVIHGMTGIAHGTEIGVGTYVSGHVCLGGSVKIGNNCFFGMQATVYDKTSICDDVTISVASVVRKNITEPGIYHGSPVKKLRLSRSK